jgi:hypothetical protein
MWKAALLCLGGSVCLFGVPASAQDPFEIHVYEYETLRKGEFTLEWNT